MEGWTRSNLDRHGAVSAEEDCCWISIPISTWKKHTVSIGCVTNITISHTLYAHGNEYCGLPISAHKTCKLHRVSLGPLGFDQSVTGNRKRISRTVNVRYNSPHLLLRWEAICYVSASLFVSPHKYYMRRRQNRLAANHNYRHDFDQGVAAIWWAKGAI